MLVFLYWHIQNWSKPFGQPLSIHHFMVFSSWIRTSDRLNDCIHTRKDNSALNRTMPCNFLSQWSLPNLTLTMVLRNVTLLPFDTASDCTSYASFVKVKSGFFFFLSQNSNFVLLSSWGTWECRTLLQNLNKKFWVEPMVHFCYRC